MAQPVSEIAPRRRDSLLAVAFSVCALILATAVTPVSAHPMPNTEIAVSLDDGGVGLDIVMPAPELQLAFAALDPTHGERLSASQQHALRAYFNQHLSIVSESGVKQPYMIELLGLQQATDGNVGAYEELRVRVWAPAREGFNPRDFTLAYDAIIHQVPTHFAIVAISQDFRGGVLPGDRAPEMGVIRFDFANNTTPPLRISAGQGSLWRGLWSTVRLGFQHVAAGLDHVLFLLTLLVVAPLSPVNGRWSLFQGWRYAVRRFLVISIAFTVGHSVALLVGAYEVVPVPRQIVEILIAASILIAAVHAMRPLWPGREWLVAAGFGTVHGLAFSESLAHLNLSVVLKAVAVFGFNLGVEGAQLVVMLIALPLLVASRWRTFHALRVAMMICTALLAGVWMVERAIPDHDQRMSMRWGTLWGTHYGG
jgi:hypothetical protein